MTRSILLAGAALLLVSISPLNAEASGAPWCAVMAEGDGDLPWACNYRSFEECYRKCDWQAIVAFAILTRPM